MREFLSHSGYFRPWNMSQFLASTGGDSFGSLADEFDQPFNSGPPLGSFYILGRLNETCTHLSSARKYSRIAAISAGIVYSVGCVTT